MKQVNSSNFNEEYYIKAYGQSRYIKEKGYFISEQNSIYQKIVDLVEIQSGDEIVDYGCGNGDLTFYLASRFRCKIVGIDYSEEAIDICNRKLSQASGHSSQVTFIYCDTDYVHDFQNTKIVFFCDVLEHMCDERIKILLKQTKERNIRDKLKVAIHTDNNNHLKFIRPFFDLLNVLLRIKSLNQVKEERRIERDLHETSEKVWLT